MAPLLEHHVKSLLVRHGLAVPAGQVVRTAAEAAPAIASVGRPVVVKALIPTGKKQKAGAVRFAADSGAALAAVGAMLGHEFAGFTASAVLVEQQLSFTHELFLSFNFDSVSRGPVALIGRSGGIHVEDAVGADPAAFTTLPIDVLDGLDLAEVGAAWARVGLAAGVAAAAAGATVAAYEVFRRYDARVLEINPLALLPDGRVCALGALMDIDDDALHRQQELAGWVEYGSGRFGRVPTPLERELLELNAREPSGSIRFMELAGGDVGCLMYGGGCSLYATDILVAGGCKPATYLDWTFPSVKLEAATIAGTLQLPHTRGLIFGCNRLSQIPIDHEVRILVDVVKQLGVDAQSYPIVVRLAGSGQDIARDLAATVPGLEYYGDEITIEDAIDRFLVRVNQSGRGGDR